MIRKLFLTGLVVFISRGSMLQLASGFLVSLFAHLLHTNVRPFRSQTDHRLQHLALTVIWLNLLLGMILKGLAGQSIASSTSSEANALGVILIVLNYSVLLMAVLFAIGLGARYVLDPYQFPDKSAQMADLDPSEKPASGGEPSGPNGSPSLGNKFERPESTVV